jgi:hypothetical protein
MALWKIVVFKMLMSMSCGEESGISFYDSMAAPMVRLSAELSGKML